jgi:hypothetical protein
MKTLHKAFKLRKIRPLGVAYFKNRAKIKYAYVAAVGLFWSPL